LRESLDNSLETMISLEVAKIKCLRPVLNKYKQKEIIMFALNNFKSEILLEERIKEGVKH
jgi:hypothetical protein